MSKYLEILGEKKFFGSENDTIRIPITLNMSDKKYYENTKFYLVNESQQFIDEKLENRFFRFYGKVNMVVNLDYQRMYDKRLKLSDFYLPTEFQTLLLKPTTTNLSNNGNYGEKIIKSTYLGNEYNIDLNLGLPLIRRTHKIITGKPRFGFRAIIGHDFQVNDTIVINSNDSEIETGQYRVIEVNGNDFFINLIDTNDKSDYTLGEYQTNITDTQYQDLAKGNLNTLNYLDIKIQAKKIINKTPLNYYIKELEVIDIFDSVNNSGFSLNSFGQPIYNYTDQTIHDFNKVLDNTGKLVNEVYIGFVKKTNTLTSTVESNFSNLISRTYQYQGLETVSGKKESNIKENNNQLNVKSTNITSTKSNVELTPLNQATIKTVGKENNSKILMNKNITTLKVGDILKYALVSFNYDTMLENEINLIEHTFLINQDDSNNKVRFSYKPFYKQEIQKYSTYIEESEVKNGTPPYAIYSDKYGKYRWRDLLDIGFFEEGVNGIDLPFLNGTFYFYSDIILNIKNHNTIKHNMNDGGFELGNSDGINEAFGDLFNNSELDIDTLSYKKYNKNEDCD